MAATSKIQNNLFVWGNVTAPSSDLADINYDQTTHTTDGEKSGNLLYATIYNSLGRNSSLIPYCLIEVLRYGPFGQQSGENLDNTSLVYNVPWDSGLTAFDIDYDVQSTEIANTLIPNLRDAINQYLKFAQTYRSIQANCWTNSREFAICDATKENIGIHTFIDGSETTYDQTEHAYLIRLPSTIKADLDGTAAKATTKVGVASTIYQLVGVTSANSTELCRSPYIEMRDASLKLSKTGSNSSIGLTASNGDSAYISTTTNEDGDPGIEIDYDNGGASIFIGPDFFDFNFGQSRDNLLDIGSGIATIGGNNKDLTIFSQKTWNDDRYFKFIPPTRFHNAIYTNYVYFCYSTDPWSENNNWRIDGSGDANLRTATFNDNTYHRGGMNYFGSADSYSINSSGVCTMQAFVATSDERLKENIKPFKSQKSILELPVVEFDFKEDGSHHIGCIAQDLQKICPEIVFEREDGYLTIEESKLVYLLLNEVKKLKEEIDHMKR